MRMLLALSPFVVIGSLLFYGEALDATTLSRTGIAWVAYGIGGLTVALMWRPKRQ